MNDRPLISVIIPMYNCGKYISKCIKSLCEQTYDELEIIIVDDGSEDNGGDVCREYARQDRRICYIGQENSGASAARNAGLKRAAGEWIAFCDSDDFMERDMLEYLYSLAVKYRADISQCGFYFDNGTSQAVQCCPKSDIIIEDFVNAESKALKYYGKTVWCKLFKHELIGHIFFDCGYSIGEDMLFGAEAALSAGKIVLGSRAEYHYIQRSGSACYLPSNKTSLVSARNVIAGILNLIPKGSNAAGFYFDEQLKNDFDICSRYVRFSPKHCDEIIDDVRNELNGKLGYILGSLDFPLKEKVKAMLITKAWKVYMMIVSRKTKGC